jgi:ribosomal protein L10
MLLGVMMAPMTKLARTLAEPSAMLARTLAARAEQPA